jgi:flavodoxin
MIFLEKLLFHFVHNEGSGLGCSEKDIAKLCPKATLLKGLAIHGSGVSAAKKEVTNWLNKLGMIS